jgi:hypothetical protein
MTLYASADKKQTPKMTGEQAMQKIFTSYKKQYKKGINLKVKEIPYYNNIPLEYMAIERGLFIGCLGNECWPYGKETYEKGSRFLDTEKLQEAFPKDNMAATEIEDANDCLGKEYIGGISGQSGNKLNKSTFTLDKFEETSNTYKFIFNTTCVSKCENCTDRADKTYTNTETRIYNKKHFFPVEITISNGNALRKVTYERTK